MLSQLTQANNLNKPSVYQALIFKILGYIKIGSLSVHFAGSDYFFGDSQHKLQAHLQINDPVFFSRVLWSGGLGLAESYIENIWQTEDLTKVLQVLANNMTVVDKFDQSLVGGLLRLLANFMHFLNKNNIIGAKLNIAKHYDLGNEFFSLFLDPTMMYSCARFDTSSCSLEQASIHKLEFICKKLELKSTDHLLEIGTGWGGLACYAAQNYGCHVTTTTISQEQFNFTQAKITKLGLEDKITVLLQDYRNLEGQFDKLVSIEMIEAVGHHYFTDYFAKCSSLVKPHGLFFLQGIMIAEQRYTLARDSVDFIKRYIFPGCCIPALSEIIKCIRNNTDYNIVTVDDITLDYAKTLRAWRENFVAQLEAIKQQGFDQEFIRKWIYYFCYCEAGFLERRLSNMQILFHKPEYREEAYASY
jgi:cyclopropane-fatty-acyl-phospholipid synthase